MPKFVWVLLIGGVATYFVHRTKRAYTWVTALATAGAAFYFWKQG